MKSGIYLIRNRVTGRCYVGSALRLRSRMRMHVQLLNRGIHANCHLQSSWIKHGPESFSLSPILICAPADLLFYEQRAIDTFRASVGVYNLAPTAGSQLGFRHTEHARSRMSVMKKGRTLSGEHRARIGMSLRGHAVSLRHRAVTSARLKGVPLSESHREKLSASHIGRRQKPEHVALRAESNRGKKRTPEQINRLIEGKKRRQSEKVMVKL